MKERTIKKLQAISINPEVSEPKRHTLKDLSSVHIDPFVVIYAIIKDVVLLINFNEHDETYDATPPILNSLLSDPRIIEALENGGITTEEYLQFMKSLKGRIDTSFAASLCARQAARQISDVAKMARPTGGKDRQAPYTIISARNLSIRYISITA